jgi:hypothetical protein
MVATAVLLLDHALLPPVASVATIVDPIHTVPVVAIAAGAAITLTVVVLLQPVLII